MEKFKKEENLVNSKFMDYIQRSKRNQDNKIDKKKKDCDDENLDEIFTYSESEPSIDNLDENEIIELIRFVPTIPEKPPVKIKKISNLKNLIKSNSQLIRNPINIVVRNDTMTPTMSEKDKNTTPLNVPNLGIIRKTTKCVCKNTQKIYKKSNGDVNYIKICQRKVPLNKIPVLPKIKELNDIKNSYKKNKIKNSNHKRNSINEINKDTMISFTNVFKLNKDKNDFATKNLIFSINPNYTYLKRYDLRNKTLNRNLSLTVNKIMYEEKSTQIEEIFFHLNWTTFINEYKIIDASLTRVYQNPSFFEIKTLKYYLSKDNNNSFEKENLTKNKKKDIGMNTDYSFLRIFGKNIKLLNISRSKYNNKNKMIFKYNDSYFRKVASILKKGLHT